MGILTRYVLGETLKLLVLGVLALAALLTLGMAAKEAVRFGMPPLVVVRALPCFLIEMVGYALPAAMLYAVCTVYGRMGADNEVVALKSLGIDPRRLVEPVLVLAVLLSLAAVISYDWTATWARPGVRHLMAESAADVALGVLRTQRSVDLPWGSIAVRDVIDERLVHPTIHLDARNDQPETVLTASSGFLERDRQGMRLVLEDIEAHVTGRGVASYPGRFVAPLPVESGGKQVHRDWLAMREIPRHVREQLQQAAESREILASTTDPVQREHLRCAAEGAEWKARRLAAEPHRRWANGFSCLAFTLLGAPLAILRKTADSITTFFAAFLPVLVGFYPLLMTSEQLAISGAAPGAIFWLADGVLASVGFWLLRRLSAH